MRFSPALRNIPYEKNRGWPARGTRHGGVYATLIGTPSPLTASESAATGLPHSSTVIPTWASSTLAAAIAGIPEHRCLVTAATYGALLSGLRETPFASADAPSATEFPAWKDNDQRVPEIDFAPDFELSHG